MNIDMYKDVKIVPVFNQQAPMVWENFVELEISAMSRHGYTYMYNAFDEMYDKYRHVYEHCSDNMSFVAYYNGEMVGFTSAYRGNTDDIYINSLFVKREMQGKGIGEKLIKSLEKSASLISSGINGFCYQWSKAFYEKMGYKISHDKMGSIVFRKKLEIPRDEIIPVFGKDLRTKFSANGFDNRVIRKNSHHPIFVHVNQKRKIDIVLGFSHKIGPDVIWSDSNIQSDIIDGYKNSVVGQIHKVR